MLDVQGGGGIGEVGRRGDFLIARKGLVGAGKGGFGGMEMEEKFGGEETFLRFVASKGYGIESS
jgi:hypothetical protein